MTCLVSKPMSSATADGASGFTSKTIVPIVDLTLESSPGDSLPKSKAVWRIEVYKESMVVVFLNGVSPS